MLEIAPLLGTQSSRRNSKAELEHNNEEKCITLHEERGGDRRSICVAAFTLVLSTLALIDMWCWLALVIPLLGVTLRVPHEICLIISV